MRVATPEKAARTLRYFRSVYGWLSVDCDACGGRLCLG